MKSLYVNEIILLRLKEKERSVAWLARQIGCDSDNLRKTLKNNHDIYTNFLLQISIALEEDFFEFYSQQFTEAGKTVKIT